jgi:hypothetical protein
MVATSDVETASELFWVVGFDWNLRGQIVLLSDSGSAPPPLQYDHLERLFGKEHLNRVSARLPEEITGIIVPGVDGDFAELVAFNKAAGQAVLEALALECANSKVAWRIVSEAEFLDTRWHG